MSRADVKPVYVLHGSDDFLLVEYRRRIVSGIIGLADPQTAVSRFDASASLADVLDELRTLPFLAPRRVVIVSDADAFVSAYREALEKYLSSPSATSSLILIVSSWPKNTRLAKLVAKIGEATDCSAPGARDLLGWLVKAAGKRGKKIDPAAAQLLLEWRGADLAGLNGEVEKLSIYVGDRPEISAQDAAALVTATAGPEAFALTNSITAGDTAGALKALAGSVTQRGEEFKTLGVIAWHLRRAMHVQQLLAKGISGAQACRSARVFGRHGEFLAMLKRRPLSILQDDFRRLLAADLAMKTGTDPAGALQQLVVALCDQRGSQGRRQAGAGN